MTARATTCRCCGQPSRSARCEPCADDLARRDHLVLSIVSALFGSAGREAFQASLRAERIRSRRASPRGRQAQATLIPEGEA